MAAAMATCRALKRRSSVLRKEPLRKNRDLQKPNYTTLRLPVETLVGAPPL
jgi:hypothetical protein